MDFEEFTNLVNKHDLTYEYSDDHSVWQRGQASYDRIKAESKHFPPEDVKRVWNAMVDKQFRPDSRANFYWR